MAINVRPVQEADLSRITDLLAQLGYPATTDQVRERLDRWLADRHSVLVTAEVDGAVAGVAACTRSRCWNATDLVGGSSRSWSTRRTGGTGSGGY
jgi:hypothetical protein